MVCFKNIRIFAFIIFFAALLMLLSCSKDVETPSVKSTQDIESLAVDRTKIVPKDQKPLRVTRMSPSGKDINVPRQIVFQFNRAVVPIGLMERKSEDIPVEITPTLNCQWRWINTSALACQLDERNVPALSTQYNVTMEPGIQAEDGAVIKDRFKASFLTQRPLVRHASFKSWRGPGTPIIRIRLNQPVAYSTLKRFISLNESPKGQSTSIESPELIISPDPDSRDVPSYMRAPGEVYGLDFGDANSDGQKPDDELLWINKEPARSIWLIEPQTPLPLDRNINLSVAPGLASALGPELGIEDRVVVNFDTFPEFEFLGVRCQTNDNKSVLISDKTAKAASKCNPLRRVALSFSAPVLNSQIEANMTLEPSLDGGRDDYNPWDNVRDYTRLRRPHRKDATYDIILPENLKAAQAYNVSMSSDAEAVPSEADLDVLQDEFGRVLKMPVDMSFSTDHRPENYVLSHNLAVLEHGVDTEMPIYMTNLDNISVNYRSLSQGGTKIGQTAERDGTGDVKDVQFVKPLGVKDMLDGESGAISGTINSVPYVKKYDSARRFFAIVSPYQLQVKMGHYNSHIWVVDLATGKPVTDAKVQIYVDRVSQLSSDVTPLDEGVTDRSGQLMLKGTKELDPKLKLFEGCYGSRRDNCDRLFVRVDKEENMSIIPLDNRFEINSYRVSNNAVWSSQQKEYGHIDSWGTTAQGVYRTGGKIQYKIYVRDQDNQTYIAAPAGSYHLKIIDPTGKTVHEVKDITLSEFGGFDGVYQIPETAPVGWYRFQLTADFTENNVWEPMRVLVSDFTPSPFKVTQQLNGELFQPGDAMMVNSQSQLHSGGPYTDADIRVTATFFPSYFSSPHPQAKGFNFNRIYERLSRPHNIFQNTGKVDVNGEAEQEIDIATQQHVSGNIRVESAVRDDRGKYVATSGRVTYLGVDRLIGMKLGQWAYDQDKPAPISYIVVDEQGDPVSGSDLEIKIEYLEVKTSRVKGAGNAYISNFTRKYIEVDSCKARSKKEVQQCVFTPERPGSYKLTASVKDSKDRTHISEMTMWVVGKGNVVWEQPNDNSLQIIPEKVSYNIGDTARYLIKNPYPGAKALVTIERYGVLKSWVQTLEGSTPVIEFDVTQDFMPGYYLSVTAISPRVDAPLPESGEVDLGKPTFKTGYIRVPVKDPYKRIDVTANTDAKVYKPRDKVVLNLAASPKFNDKDEPIEMAVVVLDEAVLDLINDGTSYFDPYEGFYALDGLDVRSYSLLTRLLGRQKFEKKGANAGGDGGADFSVRSLFKYVSYWNPSIKADENGEASVEFTVPDNLTGWRVLAFAVTPTDRMGLGQVDFKVNRPTEVRPVMPNQITEGDSFQAGFSVMNRTDKSRRLKVEITASGTLKEGRNCSVSDTVQNIVCSYSKTLRLKPYERKTVFMPIKANSVTQSRNITAGAIMFNVSAVDTFDGDGIKHVLPVKKRRSLDVAANYAFSSDANGEEPILFPEAIHTDIGEVSVLLSPSVIGNVHGAFEYIRDYKYSGWEPKLTQAVMASHYQSLKSYMPEDFVWEGSETLAQKILQQAANYQAPNGGMAYYRAQDAYVSPYLSAYTALAFNWLRDNDYEVPAEVETKLHAYLDRLLKRDVVPTFYSRGMSSSVRAVALAALSKHGKVTLNDLERYRSEINYMSLFGRAHYLQAALGVDKAKDIRTEVAEAILASSFQSGGKFSFNESFDDGYSRMLATPMRANCSILSSLTAYGQTQEGQDIVGDIPFKLTRTVTQTRGKRDHWENTQENLFCLNGLKEYAKIYEAQAPDLSVSVDIDGEAIGGTRFTALRDEPVTLSRAISDQDPGVRRVVHVKRKGEGQLYYATRLHYAPLDDHAERQNAGIDIRKEFSVERNGKWELLESPFKIKRGELVRVDIFLSLPTARNFVIVDDPIAGGLEPVNRDLATSSVVDAEKGAFKAAGGSWWFQFSDWSSYNVSRYSFHHQELRHDAARFYSDYLPAGNYVLSYTAQAIAEGDFTQSPVYAGEAYDPDVYGKGLPGTLSVKGTVNQK